MKSARSHILLVVALTCLILAEGLVAIQMGIRTANARTDGPIPLKWGVVIMGGYNYYRDLTYNAIQRIENIMQGRGVPYDLFPDYAIVAPTDTPPLGNYSLQYANGTLRYQVLILLCDYEPSGVAGVNQNYIYWAVGNGTNVVLFNRVAQAVPALLNLASGDIRWDWELATTNHLVMKTFNDGIREYDQGSNITLGATLQYHTIIQKCDYMTVWVNKTWASTWSVGMANTTYGAGNVWYLGYCLNEFRMDDAFDKYTVAWDDWNMSFWGHAINFVLNSAEKISVSIMPYKEWKGAWIIRIDTDTNCWKEAFLPPEAVLQAGWVYDYQYCVLGYARETGTADLPLTSGSPPGYTGLPSSKVMYTTITGVVQTDLINSKDYVAIIYNSTQGGNYDRIKVDFDENHDFSDDVEYKVWDNMTFPTVEGELYWDKITPDFVNPQSINVGWWQTPMLMQNESTDLPLWLQYGAEYGLSYSFHGWQHIPLASGSSYDMWNGTQFVLNTTYIAEKFYASQYWMEQMFGATGYGFEGNQVIISHPFDAHPAEVDNVINSLPWVLFQYSGQNYYIGFGLQSSTSKYVCSSSRQEDFYTSQKFSDIQDIVQTLYPVISTYAHTLEYNTSFSFPPYSNSIKPANARDAFTFWLNARNMLQSTPVAYYNQGKILLDFDASSDLKDFVWKFPVQFNGRQFSTFYDNCSTGHIAHNDGTYVYIEFGQGEGAQRIEVDYGPAAGAVNVTVSNVSPLGSGTTNPAAGTYLEDVNSVFSISASPTAGYFFDHWQVDGVNAGGANPYSLNVSVSDHVIGAFFSPIPTVNVTVNTVSPVNSGTTNPAAGQYAVLQNSTFQISATQLYGYMFDHWVLDGINVGSANPFSFNVNQSSHSIGAFFKFLTTVQLNSCDSLNGWWFASATGSIDNVDMKEGNGSLLVVPVTNPLPWNTYAVMQKSMNFSGYSMLQIWIKASDASKQVQLMVATDWNNYNVYTITGLVSNTWTLVYVNLSTPTSTTGKINFSSISFIRFAYQVQRTSAVLKIDDIRGVLR
jgi:hypothetical protein